MIEMLFMLISFTFVTKTPPAAKLILKSANIEKGSSEPNKERLVR